jgi:hypothetical protein
LTLPTVVILNTTMDGRYVTRGGRDVSRTFRERVSRVSQQGSTHISRTFRGVSRMSSGQAILLVTANLRCADFHPPAKFAILFLCILIEDYYSPHHS